MATRKTKTKKKTDEVLKIFVGHITTVAAGKDYLVREVVLAAGEETSYVFHKKRYETWIPLEGEEVKAVFDGLPTDLRLGHVVMVPRNTKYKILNNSDTDFRMLVVQSGKVIVEETDTHEASENNVPNIYKRGV